MTCKILNTTKCLLRYRILVLDTGNAFLRNWSLNDVKFWRYTVKINHVIINQVILQGGSRDFDVLRSSGGWSEEDKPWVANGSVFRKLFRENNTNWWGPWRTSKLWVQFWLFRAYRLEINPRNSIDGQTPYGIRRWWLGGWRPLQVTPTNGLLLQLFLKWPHVIK